MVREKTVANYTSQPNGSFPLDCETMQYIADNAALTEILGNIAGDKVILYGCGFEDSNTRNRRRYGYLFLRTRDCPQGEVLFFPGGAVSAGMYLKKETVTVNAAGNEYPQAYVRRSLAPGVGEENYSWDSFSEVCTNRKLEQYIISIREQLAALAGIPVGTLLVWPGTAVPSDSYMFCEGQSLAKEDYPALAAVLGTLYGGDSSTFRLPDLRGRFIAGRGSGDYASPGTKGGQEKVTLTAAQSGLPTHSHTYLLNTYSGQMAENQADRLRRGAGNHFQYRLTTDAAAAKDAAQSHENRPPYIVMNYIIKVK